MEKQKEKE